TSRFEDCGCQVRQHNEVVHDVARLRPGRKSNRERDVRAGVVEIRFSARERHPIVGGEDDDRVVQLPSSLERRNDLSGFAIEALDLEVIIENVTARLRCIGKEARYIDVSGLHSRTCATAFLIWTMWILRAETEGEGRGLRWRLVECGEARKLVGGRVPRAASRF